MRFLEISHDGGANSGVTGYFLIEIKSLFSIVLLNFATGTREAYHNHAFNAITLWCSGSVNEHMIDGTTKSWKAGQLKYTPRTTFHKVEALENTWALCIRGPWVNHWNESRLGKLFTLTHGRREI